MARVELTQEIINQRLKAYGKIISHWVCNNCGDDVCSFLYNWESHIAEVCTKCNVGELIEDKSKREVQANFYFIDKSREKNWEQGLSPMEQASVLLGETDPY